LIDGGLVTASTLAASLLVSCAAESLYALTTGSLAETVGDEAAPRAVDISVLALAPAARTTSALRPVLGNTFTAAAPKGLRVDGFAIPGPTAVSLAIPAVDVVDTAEFLACRACSVVADGPDESAPAVPQPLPITAPIPSVTANVPTLPMNFVESMPPLELVHFCW
jgi:hypothetical protein